MLMQRTYASDPDRFVVELTRGGIQLEVIETKPIDLHSIVKCICFRPYYDMTAE